MPSGSFFLPPQLYVIAESERLHAISQSTGVSYNTSADGGRTWLPAPRSCPAGGQRGTLVARGDLLIAIAATASGLFVHRSTDGAQTWLPPVAVSPTSTAAAAPQLVAAGGALLAFWVEQRVGAGEVYGNRSTDDGQSWLPVDVRFDVGIVDQLSSRPVVAVDGTTVHLAWSEGPAGAQTVYYQRSADLGATWNASPVALPLSGLAEVAAIAADSGTVLIGADGVQSPSMQCGILRSGDGGSTWVTTFVSSNLARVDQLVLDGNRAIVMGASDNTVMRAIAFCLHSVDGGSTWATTLLPPVNYSSAWLNEVSFASEAKMIVAVRAVGWVISAIFYWNAVVERSIDGGTTWSSLPSSMQGNRTVASVHSTPHGWLLSAYSTSVLTPQPWVELLAGHQRYGTGTAGLGAIEPTLNGSGVTVLGSAASVGLASARGGAAGLIAVTAAGPANVPLGSATLLVQTPVATFFFVASGAPGAAGVGSATLPLAVPNSISFSGLRLNCQGFVLDAAAIDGFAATAGLETWVL